MKLRVSQDIWCLYPAMKLVVAAGSGLDNNRHGEGPAALLATTQEQVRTGWAYPNPQSHPRIAAWRQAARAAGISGKKFPSSIEALTKRLLAGKPLPSINPLVDLYNALSYRHTVPLGAWDTDTLRGDLHLRLTTDGDTFRPLGGTQTETIEPGEVAYTDDEEVITRHFVWRQSEKGKVEPTTRSFFLVSEILPEAGEGTAEAVLADVGEEVERFFGVQVRAAILENGTEAWAL